MSTASQFEQLCAHIQSEMEERNVPGVAVGILQNDTMHTAGFGITNVQHSLPVTDDTRFQIGSISKTMTGMAVMRLVEHGKLNLDAPVRTYLPNFKVPDSEASEHVTLRHLLTHTAGWDGDFFHDTGPGADALPRYVEDMATREQMAPLGTVFSYNNAGFVILGAVLEVVGKKPAEAIIKSSVLNPLRMASACFDPNDVITHRFATGHNAGKKRPKIARPWGLPRYAWAAGGVICHVKDLLKYGQFHLGNGKIGNKRLLKTSSMKQMQSPQHTIGQLQESIGLSWFIDHIDDVKILSHGGSTVGQNAHLMIVPKRKLAFAILTNVGNGGALIQSAKDWVTKEYLNLKSPKPKPRKTTSKQLELYAGRYSRPTSEIQLVLKKGTLYGQTISKSGFPTEKDPPPPPSPPSACTLSRKDCLIMTDGPGKGAQFEIIRKPDKTIGWLRLGLRIFKRVK